ncbi:uncharacterized protein LOC117787569 [Drosophila innubila]|uniref:uncharacterized protein LOC117787569 n=1 Tax=Drosophila innubila TaxID=198719 RepID=UPI00148C57DE|nr:uncharacterized protein LOC117787569 [Drosophila innubila]
MSWLQLLLLLHGLSLWVVEARWTVRPRRTTSTTSTTAQPDRHQHVHHWPPLIAPKAPAQSTQPPTPSSTPTPPPNPDSFDSIRLIEDFDQRSPDGQHEYRYQLSNGDTRYERTFWMPVGKNWVLARRGYYSVPLPNAQYSTVFYRADHHGYHVDTHTLSGEQPLLPRTLEVPHDMLPVTKSTPTAKRNSISVLERNEDAQMAVGNATQTRTRTRAQTQTRTRSQSPTDAKVQAEVQIQQQQNRQSQKLKQNKTKPSTVAKVDDILATEVGIAALDVADDDDDDVVADDGDMTESQQSTRM